MKETDKFTHIRGQSDLKTFTLENHVNDLMKCGYSISNIWMLKLDGNVILIKQLKQNTKQQVTQNKNPEKKYIIIFVEIMYRKA